MSSGDTAGEVPATQELPYRVMPAVTVDNEHFWRGGADGELRILRCDACGHWIHPPAPICPECLGREVTPRATSGEATVLTYTVNHQLWYPNLDPPYVVAIVDLPEQVGLRLTTNIVNCDPGDVDFGMAVQVTFLEYPDSRGNVWLPMFEPADGTGTADGTGAGTATGGDTGSAP